MLRKPFDISEAKMEFSTGVWRIYWYWRSGKYAFFTTCTNAKVKKQVELLGQVVCSRAFASKLPGKPPWLVKGIL